MYFKEENMEKEWLRIAENAQRDVYKEKISEKKINEIVIPPILLPFLGIGVTMGILALIDKYKESKDKTKILAQIKEKYPEIADKLKKLSVEDLNKLFQEIDKFKEKYPELKYELETFKTKKEIWDEVNEGDIVKIVDNYEDTRFAGKTGVVIKRYHKSVSVHANTPIILVQFNTTTGEKIEKEFDPVEIAKIIQKRAKPEIMNIE